MVFRVSNDLNDVIDSNDFNDFSDPIAIIN